ncbi:MULTISPECIES: MerR family DNA-binding protein [Shewanella]|uniref:HTH-type transcriptional regulator CueR n=1 Tax=Shewanella fidelis TaxID=173509 RepID=A0AAW8NIM8_9GAMM|nr:MULTISPECIES: MerR family DNA-binding protein [Shewanella]MDR8523172.1 MerR family DNA-binding protein [Shewanella fidelis]MDW4811502.1 MerR family DNA-binding protein [Shewanella fidelis]MDW4815623.1 MerR family DNA-binding protein [Shewanella fidelis]MDW4819713.1 MerR family DNA-binding protein [Shewanella fidelis]MDW4824313.1 MerR family DNA-binding protein [Shewanella fidelis]
MKIGEVAKITGLSVKSIRYYHDIGLVVGQRNDNGYREYNQQAIESLEFIQHCRALGFTLDDSKALLELQNNTSRNAADVKALAEHHLQDIDTRIQQMMALKAQLAELINECQGGNQPNCAILSGLSKHTCKKC